MDHEQPRKAETQRGKLPSWKSGVRPCDRPNRNTPQPADRRRRRDDHRAPRSRAGQSLSFPWPTPAPVYRRRATARPSSHARRSARSEAKLQARRENLRRGRTSLTQQIERLTEAYLGGVVPLAEFERRRRETVGRLAALERQEQELLADARDRHETARLTDNAEEFCRRIRDGLDSADFERKRALLELLVDRVVVTDGEVEIRYAFPTGPNGEREPFCRLRTDYLPLICRSRPGRQAGRIHVALPHAPVPAFARHVRSVLVGGSQAHCMCVRPTRVSQWRMVEVAPTTIPYWRSSVWISLSEVSALVSGRANTTAPCGSRMGWRCPPKRAGAGLPLWRKRCISVTAADGLTSKRRAACRMDNSPCTARTIRSSKSRDRGAGMGCSRPNGISSTDSAQPLHALTHANRRPC